MTVYEDLNLNDTIAKIILNYVALTSDIGSVARSREYGSSEMRMKIIRFPLKL